MSSGGGSSSTKDGSFSLGFFRRGRSPFLLVVIVLLAHFPLSLFLVSLGNKCLLFINHDISCYPIDLPKGPYSTFIKLSESVRFHDAQGNHLLQYEFHGVFKIPPQGGIILGNDTADLGEDGIQMFLTRFMLFFGHIHPKHHRGKFDDFFLGTHINVNLDIRVVIHTFSCLFIVSEFHGSWKLDKLLGKFAFVGIHHVCFVR
mmetsp:Transcript_9036/g.20873  ORF Transcript_9036/g.20873 Transcript_9036/m.20873 type:complete len:202 (+) Transcript_9036:1852-2457(+)